MHLLIPFACAQDPQAHAALKGLKLPHLAQLIARMVRGPVDAADIQTLTPPHERILAHVFGLISELTVNDGLIPSAAWSLAQSGQNPGQHAWAQITPCHWTVNSDHIVMSDPADLQLQESESRILLGAMKPYFDEDGIVLQYAAPDRWLARSELFRTLPTASIDRVANQAIDAWLPKAPQAAPIRRLQNEMQMLLYTHPVNDQRADRGLATINSFWVSGTGALHAAGAELRQDGSQIAPTIADSLRGPAISRDWSAWMDAWRAIDGSACANLLRELKAGKRVSLTLCGERNAITWKNRPPGLLSDILSRIVGQIGHQPLYDMHEQL